MEPLAVVLNRFMRLLPFLTAPNSCRRFHLELFYPYPDVSNGSDSPPRLLLTLPNLAPRARRRKHARASSPPLGHSMHPYLTPTDLDASHLGRREPFC